MKVDILLACGGRNFTDIDYINRTLDTLYKMYKFKCLRHGAASGADTLSGVWARDHKIEVQEFPANWAYFGRSAGYNRNLQMMCSKPIPDLVIAFPGGKGTKNMVDIAINHKCPVIVCYPDTELFFGFSGVLGINTWWKIQDSDAITQEDLENLL